MVSSLCYYYLYIFVNISKLNNRIILKYYAWFLFLDNIKCFLVKPNVMLFPTLTFNKRTIISIIDVLCTLANQLAVSKKMVYDKVIMIKGNLLTIRNVIQTIF